MRRWVPLVLGLGCASPNSAFDPTAASDDSGAATRGDDGVLDDEGRTAGGESSGRDSDDANGSASGDSGEPPAACGEFSGEHIAIRFAPADAEGGNMGCENVELPCTMTGQLDQPDHAHVDCDCGTVSCTAMLEFQGTTPPILDGSVTGFLRASGSIRSRGPGPGNCQLHWLEFAGGPSFYYAASDVPQPDMAEVVVTPLTPLPCPCDKPDDASCCQTAGGPGIYPLELESLVHGHTLVVKPGGTDQFVVDDVGEFSFRVLRAQVEPTCDAALNVAWVARLPESSPLD